ncbi:MAG: helix-turn-helix transcriptional regulator [Pseudomonas umsongensis]|nr:helix-turn-helix transcriptional regulator [Pseudomonas umsongensis]
MELKKAFGTTLKETRLNRRLTQEDFSLVSSRTNVSLLERGGTSPTLEKLDALCSVLEIHPVSLLAACYMRKESAVDITDFLKKIEIELETLKKT